jgi:hypothetical protein
MSAAAIVADLHEQALEAAITGSATVTGWDLLRCGCGCDKAVWAMDDGFGGIECAVYRHESDLGVWEWCRNMAPLPRIGLSDSRRAGMRAAVRVPKDKRLLG